MPALSTQEHAQVLAQTKARRNAYAWVRRRGGTVVATPGFNGGRDTHYLVRIPHFKPGYGIDLVQVVAALRFLAEYPSGGDS